MAAQDAVWPREAVRRSLSPHLCLKRFDYRAGAARDAGVDARAETPATRDAAAEARAEVSGRQAEAADRYAETKYEPAFGRRFRSNGRFGAQLYRGGPYAASLLGKDYFGQGERMTLGGAYTGDTDFVTAARLGLDGQATDNTIPENLLSSFWATGRKVPAQVGANAYTTTFGRRRNLRRPMRFF